MCLLKSLQWLPILFSVVESESPSVAESLTGSALILTLLFCSAPPHSAPATSLAPGSPYLRVLLLTLPSTWGTLSPDTTCLSHLPSSPIFLPQAYTIDFFAVTLKNLFLCFNWRIITLQYCDGFCQTSTWVGHKYNVLPTHPKPHSRLPPHPIPLGCLRPLALGALRQASNAHWSSIWYVLCCA